MRQLVRDFVALCAETIETHEPIYEFGALNVPGQEGFADLREFFPGKQYIGADMRHGPGVDLLLDLHDIALPDASAGTVISVETLEHVEHPQRAVAEMLRVLSPGGALILTSVLNFPIHDYPADYWRFTPGAFRSMLQPCPSAIIDSLGEVPFPHTVVAVAFKFNPPASMIATLTDRISAWKDKWLDARVTAPWSASAMYVPMKELEANIQSLEARCAKAESERDYYKSMCESSGRDKGPANWIDKIKETFGAGQRN